MVSNGDASVKTMDKIGNNWSSTIKIWKLKLFFHQNTRYLTWWSPRPQITQVTSWDVHHALMVPGFDLRGSHHSIHYSIAFVLGSAGFNQPKYGMWWEFMGYMKWETQQLLIFVCFFNGMHPPFFGHHRDKYDKPFLVGGFNQPLWKIWVRQLGWWNSQWFSSHIPNHQSVYRSIKSHWDIY